jgi:Holliday junction resolvasome RuvABC endonuclease subunit
VKILAFDQATKMGYSVFQNGNLVSYGYRDFSKFKLSDKKYNEIKLQVGELIDLYKPDIVAIEDCQLQRNPKVFKSLAILQGVLRDYFYENDVKYEVVPVKTWRSTCGIKSGKREKQKADAISFVQKMFNIEGDIDDIAESICIGYHMSQTHIDK